MSRNNKHISPDDFSRRWFALWTEAVAELWATNGAQVLVDPPQAVRAVTT